MFQIERGGDLVQQNHHEKKSRALIVDDDIICARTLQRMLEKYECAAVVAESVNEATSRLMEEGCESFDVVVSDFNLGRESGSALLEWLRRVDPSLSTIVVTGSGGREAMSESLRNGVSGFIEKPVVLPVFLDAVAKAMNVTRERRRSRQNERNIHQIAQLQNALIRMHSSSVQDRIHVFYRPKQQVGGDFLSVFPRGSERFVALVTDVSGHDLAAGFLSSYFQGVMSGMIHSGGSLSRIFGFFNSYLVDTWNREGASRVGGWREVSLAACAVDVDMEARLLRVVNSGFPQSLLLRGEDWTVEALPGGGNPLGWFAAASCQEHELSLEGGKALLLWSDGLEDFASARGVDPLAVAARLELDNASAGSASSVLGSALDDILSARIVLEPMPDLSEMVLPLLCQTYAGDQAVWIDAFQGFWKDSLQFALRAELGEEKLHDILLCAREAVLNALNHGCGGKEDTSMVVQMNYHPDRGEVRVRVCDPGEGHHFDVEAHEQSPADGGLVDKHRGLSLIRLIANEVRRARDGAVLVMVFKISPGSCDTGI